MYFMITSFPTPIIWCAKNHKIPVRNLFLGSASSSFTPSFPIDTAPSAHLVTMHRPLVIWMAVDEEPRIINPFEIDGKCSDGDERNFCSLATSASCEQTGPTTVPTFAKAGGKPQIWPVKIDEVVLGRLWCNDTDRIRIVHTGCFSELGKLAGRLSARDGSRF